MNDPTTQWPPPRFTQSDVLPMLGLTVAWHPDPRRVGEMFEWFCEQGYRVEISRATPEFAQPGEEGPRPLADRFLSRTPVQLTATAMGGVRIDLEGPNIFLEVNGVSVSSQCELTLEEVDAGAVLLLNERVLLVLHRRQPMARRPPRYDMVGECSRMIRVRQQIERLAKKSKTVLVRGENGTGKELVARALHNWGVRKDHSFLSINVALVPPDLAAAEFFGSRKGAFTNADQRKGYFRNAEGGTLFLDEIGDIPPLVQVGLLRALENGEVQPLGATRPLKVDVRVVGATDRNLEEAVAAGEFRQPLFFRLAERVIELPPLRQRKEDIGRLLIHFLKQELGAQEMGRLCGQADEPPWWIPARAVAHFVMFSWPGNVRQLKHLVSAMVEESLDLPEVALPRELSQVPEMSFGVPKVGKDPESISCAELRSLLQRAAWQVRPVARHLGVSADTVYRRMASCHCKKAGDLTTQEVQRALEEKEGDLAATAEALQVSLRGLKQRMKVLNLR